MPPKGKRKEAGVKTTFQRASTTPSKRPGLPKPPKYVMRTPEFRSPLHRYITENADSGLSVSELVEQFQEYDCSHRNWIEIASSPTQVIRVCDLCQKRETVPRSGVS